MVLLVLVVDYWWSGFGSVAGILVLVDYRPSGFVLVVYWYW